MCYSNLRFFRVFPFFSWFVVFPSLGSRAECSGYAFFPFHIPNLNLIHAPIIFFYISKAICRKISWTIRIIRSKIKLKLLSHPVRSCNFYWNCLKYDWSSYLFLEDAWLPILLLWDEEPSFICKAYFALENYFIFVQFLVLLCDFEGPYVTINLLKSSLSGYRKVANRCE